MNSKIIKKRKTIVEDTRVSGNECPICLDPWNNQGKHRIVSLECGHLFGHRCIERWIHERKSCPQCNCKVKKSSIRPLFITNIVAQDNSREESLLKMYETERKQRIRAELEKSEAILRCQHLDQLVKENNLTLQKLKHRIDELEKSTTLKEEALGDFQQDIINNNVGVVHTHTPRSKDLKEDILDGVDTSRMKDMSQNGSDDHSLIESMMKNSSDGSDDDNTLWNYRRVTSVQLTHSRVFCISQENTVVCASSRMNERHFGITKISVLDPRHRQNIAIHWKPIRDIKESSSHRDILLTTSFDKSLKLTSLQTASNILSYSLPHPGWSCSFDPSNDKQVYCGLSNGTIQLYDIRQTSQCVTEFVEKPATPIHSLHALCSSNSNVPSILSGSISQVSAYRTIESLANTSISPVQFDTFQSGRYVSLGMDQSQTQVVASLRGGCNEASHVVLNLDTNIHTVLKGHSTPLSLTRTAIWKVDSQSLVSSGDDTTKETWIWDLQTRKIVQTLPSHNKETILDIQHSCSSKDDLLGTLSENELRLYKYETN